MRYLRWLDIHPPTSHKWGRKQDAKRLMSMWYRDYNHDSCLELQLLHNN